jgi:hypothetical protein
MFLADEMGLDEVTAALARFERALGPQWAPAPLLERLAERGEALLDPARSPGALAERSA